MNSSRWTKGDGMPKYRVQRRFHNRDEDNMMTSYLFLLAARDENRSSQSAARNRKTLTRLFARIFGGQKPGTAR